MNNSTLSLTTVKRDVKTVGVFRRLMLSVALISASIGTATGQQQTFNVNVDNTTTGVQYMPFYATYKYSTTVMIYTSDLIPNSGTITGINFYSNNDNPSATLDILKIYFAITDLSQFGTTQSNFLQEFYDNAQNAQQVYSGTNVTIGNTIGWQHFELDTPFDYDKTEGNLMIFITHKSNTRVTGQSWRIKTKYQTVLQRHSNNDNYSYYGDLDPNQYDGFDDMDVLPQIQLVMSVGPFYYQLNAQSEPSDGGLVYVGLQDGTPTQSSSTISGYINKNPLTPYLVASPNSMTHRFVGWSTTANGSVVSSDATYCPELTVGGPDADHPTEVDYYAIFQPYPTGITATPSSTTVYVGSTQDITYTLTPDGAYDNITVTSDNTSIATVSKSDNTVTISGVSVGSTFITISARNSSDEDICSTTVNVKVKNKVATPQIIFTPLQDNINKATVTITCGTTGAVIYYTTDGTTPDPLNAGGANATKIYDSSHKPVIDDGITINTIAIMPNDNDDIWDDSEEESNTYFACFTDDPVITFGTDNEKNATVTISAENGATIYYTLDGSEPTTSSPLHGTTSIVLDNIPAGITTIKAFAKNGDCHESAVVEKEIEIKGGIIGTDVVLYDYEDHKWSYYSDPDCPIRSLNPVDVKITYYGNGTGTVSTTNGPNPTDNSWTVNASGVQVGPDEPQNRFIYYKTLERTDGETATQLNNATGRCEYTTIANPFTIRPTYVSGDVDVSIGSGTTDLNYLPTRSNINYSLTQQIYTSTEIGMSGTIRTISFYMNENNTTRTRNIDIFFRHTTKTSFSSTSDWENVSSTDKVFSGNFTFTSGWNTITLSTPFNYNGTDNLLVCVDDNTGSYQAGYIDFYYYNTGTNTYRSLYINNNNTNFDPTNAQSNYTGTRTNYCNIINFGNGSGDGNYRGFYKWRIKKLEHGTIYAASEPSNNETTYQVGDMVDADSKLYFQPDPGYEQNGMVVDFEALWAKAYVVTSNTTTGLNANVSYERNFVYLTSNTTLNNGSLGVPVTYTTLDPATGQGTKKTITIQNNFTCQQDTKFENLIFAQYNNNSQYIYAAGHDLIIDRGCSGTIDYLYGLSANTTTSFRMRIESGSYTDLYFLGQGKNFTNDAVLTTTLGCDYDRAQVVNGSDEYNNRLHISHDIALSINATIGRNDNPGAEVFRCTVKSGNFDLGSANYGGNYQFYISGYGSSGGTPYTYGKRTLVVEGGVFSDISGGMETDDVVQNSVRMVDIRIKGGTVNSIVYGAAQYSGATGERRMVFTGGTVMGWIAGGANGTRTTGGELNGDTYIYFGGKAQVGDENGGTPVGGQVSYTASNVTYYGINGADGGMIFGAGCGINPTNSNYESDGTYQTNTVGRVDNSNIVIADEAIVWGDVYGGGNYGFVKGQNEGEGDAKVYIIGGNVKGNVFGGSNNQQGQNVDILMRNGTVEGGLYGGSNSWGTINNDVKIQIDGGQVGKDAAHTRVHGGGFGRETKVTGNVEINIGNETTANQITTYTGDAIIYGDIYGGSALGSVNGTSANTAHHTYLTLNSGTIYGSLYGGALGQKNGINGASNDIEANVYGPVLVTVNGGSLFGSVFGCNNLNGSPKSTVEVVINRSDPTTYDNLNKKIYAINGVYGGGNLADYTPSTIDNYPVVTINASNGCETPSIKDVYGGGNAAAVPYTKVTVMGGDIYRVFGGGNGESGDPAHVGRYTDSNITYGSGNTNVFINGGTIYQVFGGSNANGEIKGAINVTAQRENDNDCPIQVTELYGGGNMAPSNVGNITIGCMGANDMIDYVFGGANAAAVTGDIELDITGGRINNLFGGNNNSGTVDGTITINVDWSLNTCNNNYLGNIYGAGNLATYAPLSTDYPEINLKQGIVSGNVFGGGKGSAVDLSKGVVTGNPVVNIGYNDMPDSIKVLGNVYGGGEVAGINGYTRVIMQQSDSSIVYGNIFGAGKGVDDVVLAALVRDSAVVRISKGLVRGSVYGGGELSSVGDFTYSGDQPTGLNTANTGITYVTVSGSAQIGRHNMKMTAAGGPDDYGHVFGAGKGMVGDISQNAHIPYLANVYDAFVTIADSAFVMGSVYGGSENGHVKHNTYVYIKDKCQVGNGFNTSTNQGVNRRYTNQEWASGSLYECASWPYSTDNALPYDIFANDYASGGATSATNGATFYGNVFGGGSGYYPYAPGQWLRDAGQVEGDTRVEITGGHILTSVYGGNELTDVIGNCTIIMSGGTVGVPRTLQQMLAHPVTCYVFGAGKGDARSFFNARTNVAGTDVSVSGGRIYGSVFGGGEDGHVLGDAHTTISGSAYIGTTGTSSADGNIFGGGRGFSGTALTAGVIAGNVTVDIQGGTMLGTIFGGGRLASVGTHLVPDNNENYGKMIPDGKDMDGNDAPGATHGHITVNITGGVIGATDNEGNLVTSSATIGDVYGGGKGKSGSPLLGLTKNTTVNISEADSNTPTFIHNSVYGGGEAGNVAETVLVNINGGTIDRDVYGGGALANTNIGNASDYGTRSVSLTSTSTYSTTVNLNGGIMRNVYGGGLGQKGGYNGAASNAASVEALVYGDVKVNLNKDVDDDAKGAIVTDNLFGCNNVNGTPLGDVTVHVYATQNSATNSIEDKNINPFTFDVGAVYGGGNMAAYIPYSTDSIIHVIIEGCGKTSIGTVYGGGNAAPVSATNVLIMGSDTIGSVYGGGNGKDQIFVNGNYIDNPGADVGIHKVDETEYTNTPDLQYSDSYNTSGLNGNYYLMYADTTGTSFIGTTYVQILGGIINEVFGGSNTRGNVIKNAQIKLGDQNLNTCDFKIGSVYGGSNEAPMAGSIGFDMNCVDGMSEIYGGSKKADVNNDIVLTITGGHYDKVFGGNNISGRILGSITVNIEQTGCLPIEIGELYGGGNQAPYSIYGYDGETVGTDNITRPNPRTEAQNGVEPYNSPILNIVSFKSINKVFGGGLGETATMVGNPIININTVKGWTNGRYKGKTGVNNEYSVYSGVLSNFNELGTIDTVFGGGNQAKVQGETNINIGTENEVTVHNITKSVYEAITGNNARTDITNPGYSDADTIKNLTITVEGANITGNVYGGGNRADVTNGTNIQVGHADTGSPAPQRTTSAPQPQNVAGGESNAVHGVNNTIPAGANSETNTAGESDGADNGGTRNATESQQTRTITPTRL